MKKRIGILAFILAAMLFISCCHAEDELAEAFSGTAKLKLVPVEMEELPADEENVSYRFLDLCPDGKTLLCLREESHTETIVVTTATPAPEDGGEQKKVSIALPGRNKAQSGPREVTVRVGQFCLVRDGKIIPIATVPEKGSGDPYGKLSDGSYIRMSGVPGKEGFSWSSDGRYFTFSNIEKALDQFQYLDTPVIDTESKEFWLADSYSDNLIKKDGGTVILSKMSRAGDYVYYLAICDADDKGCYCFCRCTPDGRNREILCKTEMHRFQTLFHPFDTSDLFEMSDGSWIMQGARGDYNYRNIKEDTISLIHFAPSGDQWTAEVIPTAVPLIYKTGRFLYSAASGYGMMLIHIPYNKDIFAGTDTDPGAMDGIRYIADSLRLLRICPGGQITSDVWYIRKSWPEDENMEMVSGEARLEYIRAWYEGGSPTASEEYDGEASIRQPYPKITNACLSPDGRYALLHGNENSEYCFYLIDMETMAIRPVESPEGTASLDQVMPLHSSYYPAMRWNQDGTLVFAVEDGVGLFRLTVE